MKRFYILSILLAAVVASASAQISAFFDRYADTKGVTSVYISNAMFRMMSGPKVNGLDFNDMFDKLDCIRVLTTESSEVAAKMSKALGQEIKKDGYEILLSANDDGEKAQIYFRTGAKGVSDYLIVNEDSGELNIVLISGNITPADISKMTNRK